MTLTINLEIKELKIEQWQRLVKVLEKMGFKVIRVRTSDKDGIG